MHWSRTHSVISAIGLALLIAAGAIVAVVAARSSAQLAVSRQEAGDAPSWLEKLFSEEELNRLAHDVVRSVDEALHEAIRESTRRSESELGTRFLAESAPDGALRWIRSADRTAPMPPRVVLLVHGLDEPGDIWNDLAPALHEQHYTVARFEYANDQPPARSAEALFEALRQLSDQGVTSVDLVCHSMGGLISRDVLTRPSMYGGDARQTDTRPAIPRLITIGTPNAGSPFASLRAIGELREQIMRAIDTRTFDAAQALTFLVDGEGEAGEDLKPGSAYLKELNARDLPERVHHTIIAGKLAVGDVRTLRGVLSAPVVRDMLSEADIQAMEQNAEALSTFFGDGVVPTDSAMLKGIDDTVVVEGNHRSIVRQVPIQVRAEEMLGKTPGPPPAIAIVLNRLSSETAAPRTDPVEADPADVSDSAPAGVSP